jgi:hypothetical protein
MCRRRELLFSLDDAPTGFLIMDRRVIKDYKFRPYAKYELATTTFEGIISHTFEAGISVGITDAIIGELYCMHQENESTLAEDDWNTVGLEFKILL